MVSQSLSAQGVWHNRNYDVPTDCYKRARLLATLNCMQN